MQNYRPYHRHASLKWLVKSQKNRQQVDHKYYVGKGKIDEIKAFIDL